MHFLPKQCFLWPTALPQSLAPCSPPLNPSSLQRVSWAAGPWATIFLRASSTLQEVHILNKPGYSPEGQAIPRAVLILPSLLQADQQSPASVSTKSLRTQVRLLSSPLDERERLHFSFWLGVWEEPITTCWQLSPEGSLILASYPPPLYPGGGWWGNADSEVWGQFLLKYFTYGLGYQFKIWVHLADIFLRLWVSAEISSNQKSFV